MILQRNETVEKGLSKFEITNYVQAKTRTEQSDTEETEAGEEDNQLIEHSENESENNDDEDDDDDDESFFRQIFGSG